MNQKQSLLAFIQRDCRDTIVIIPTGGTVAAKGGARTDTSHYKAGAIDIDDLLLPIRGELEKIANIETQQILSIDSANSRPGHIIMIKNRLEETLSKPDIIGTVSLGGSTVMITQCRCLVHLIELSGRSLIVTGACKPHTAYGSEGLANILASARTLSDYKQNNVFVPGASSLLGKVVDFRAEIENQGGVDNAIKEGVKGAILVVYDDGYWPDQSMAGLKELVNQGDTLVAAVSYGSSFGAQRPRIDGVVPASDWTDRDLLMFLPILLSSNLSKAEKEDFLRTPHRKNNGPYR
ncbi:Asparaginase/glutaminase [Fusarium oxysporum]|nr:Asparaginase/glutaminase [Fusarium oxysporum]